MTVANGAVLLGGAEPSPQTKDFTLELGHPGWTPTLASTQLALPPCRPQPLLDLHQSKGHVPPRLSTHHRAAEPLTTDAEDAQHHTSTGTAQGEHGGHAGDVPGWMSLVPKDCGMQREGGIEKPRAAGLETWQTEERFQDSLGRELVSASRSAGVLGGPEPCEVFVPSAVGWRAPGSVLSRGWSEPGTSSPSRGRSAALDVEDRVCPGAPEPGTGTKRGGCCSGHDGLGLDWDWTGTGLGQD